MNLDKLFITKENDSFKEGIYFTLIPSIQIARKLLGPSCEKIRKKRSTLFYSHMAHQKARKRLRLGMHDRGEEYIYADGKIEKSDLQGHKRHFPLHLKVMNLKEYHLNSKILDITNIHKDWGDLHYKEELYLYVHIEKLYVKPASKIRIKGNILVLICDEIILEDKNDEKIEFTIEILGTPHTAYSKYRNAPASKGRDGKNGENGKHAEHIKVEMSPFGLSPLAKQQNPNGLNGKNGTAGSDGENGENGGMLMLSDIRIGKLTNFSPKSFQIFAQANQGQDGSDGGNGGNGGDGGNGSDGIKCINNPITGGKGGIGGDGGDAGNGSIGGNGGLASNIFLQIPEQYLRYIQITSLNSKGGRGGKAGLAGLAGKNGTNGKLYTNKKSNNTEPSPKDGKAGKDARSGKERKCAKVHILTI